MTTLPDELLHWLNQDRFPLSIAGYPFLDQIVARCACDSIANWEAA